MEILIVLGQFILCLSILVVLHELGHFIPAKLFKMRVDKFYLFFDPKFSLFKIKKGETEYGIGWLPLGGYVKIAGMVDESMDKDQLAEPPKEWEFRSKPAWQRLIVMIGGVTVNIILAFIIYVMLTYVYGISVLPGKNIKEGLVFHEQVFKDAGFQDGDRITKIEGEEVVNYMDINKEILINGARNIQVERNGQLVDLKLAEDIENQLIVSAKRGWFDIMTPPIAKGFGNDQFEKAGIKKDDQLYSINGVHYSYQHEITKEFRANPNTTFETTWLRGSDTITAQLKTDTAGVLGVRFVPDVFYQKELGAFDKQYFSFFGSIPVAMNRTFGRFTEYARSTKLVFKEEGAKRTGGLLSILNIFPPHWDPEVFWGVTAFLSLALAFLNILPIPALDGGHVVFTLYEIISGRPPGQKFLEKAQVVGFVILISLIVLTNGNDIYRWLTGAN